MVDNELQTVIITPAKAVPELAPQPSPVIAVQKGGRVALISLLAVAGMAAVDALVPLITPESLGAILDPVLARVPTIPQPIVIAVVMALIEAYRANRKAKGVAMAANRAVAGAETVTTPAPAILVRGEAS